MIIELLDNRSS